MSPYDNLCTQMELIRKFRDSGDRVTILMPISSL